jgi:hypothetical protein
VGVGGSLIYKTAYFKGIAMGVGLYTTQAKGSLSKKETYLYKAGKGVFSRYDRLTKGKHSITSLAQGYVEYRYGDFSLRVGRQAFESSLTKSNDTKMIPNTFEGVTLETKALSKTTLKMAYLTKQKLRDHSTFHHLLAYGDEEDNPYTKYSQNDDAGMHKGLGLSKLKNKNIEDRLWIMDVKNRSIKNTTFYLNYTSVPKLLSWAMFQMNYRFDIASWSVIPAIRVMQQFDDGAGEIAGANLKTLTSSYKASDSLDATLYGTRLDVVKDALKLRFGYTQVADKADIVAPWRGFPTGGFTRAMSQYNWYANTKSYMVQLDYTFEMMPDIKILSRFVIQDFDDKKVGVQADSKLFTLDIIKSFENHPLYLKTRFGHVVGDADTIASNGVLKLDPSYDEFRFEINYLF